MRLSIHRSPSVPYLCSVKGFLFLHTGLTAEEGYCRGGLLQKQTESDRQIATAEGGYCRGSTAERGYCRGRLLQREATAEAERGSYCSSPWDCSRDRANGADLEQSQRRSVHLQYCRCRSRNRNTLFVKRKGYMKKQLYESLESTAFTSNRVGTGISGSHSQNQRFPAELNPKLAGKSHGAAAANRQWRDGRR